MPRSAPPQFETPGPALLFGPRCTSLLTAKCSPHFLLIVSRLVTSLCCVCHLAPLGHLDALALRHRHLAQMSFPWRPTFWTPSISDTLPFQMFLQPFQTFCPLDLSTSDFRIWIRTSGSGPGSRTLPTSLGHLAHQIPSPPLLRMYGPDLRNLCTPGLPDATYCHTGSRQILWPLHSTSALAPLSKDLPSAQTALH
ncbi:hypothetical protein K438DRAFT_524153 [Mycena galopus ATCC 62051]|nr:hypothetical protein K438DRAFT_524153 [Mycena galopus ATCC 62051]